MPQFDTFAADALAALPEDVAAAVCDAPLADLGDGPQVAALAALLRNAASASGSAGWDGVAPNRKALCMSGLWLAAGDLDRSHTISQSIDSAEGSFWHGIMHRREGDFGNSKYWFRRVGSHPLFEQIAEQTNGLYADPFDFVDCCSRAVAGGGDDYQDCQAAQWKEWQSLMVHCLGE